MMTTSQHCRVSRLRVLSIVPILKPLGTDLLALRFAERFKPRWLEMSCEEVAVEIAPAVARALRRLKAVGKVEGPPWRRA